MGMIKLTQDASAVSLADARDHLRIIPFGSPLSHPDDGYITSLLSASETWCESYTGRAITSNDYEITLDKFEDSIDLITPCTHIVNVKYYDTNNVLQTLASSNYELDKYSFINKMVRVGTYPATYTKANAVIIKISAGYDEVPEPIKHAIKLMVGSYYENRKQDYMANARISFNTLPNGVYSLLQFYRVNDGL